MGWRPVGPSEHKQATRKKTAAPKYLDKKVDPEKHSGCTRRSGLKLEPEVCVVAPPASPKIGGAASPLYLPQAVHEADTGTPASPAFRRVDSSSLIAWRTHLDFRASLTSSTCNASHLGPEKKNLVFGRLEMVKQRPILVEDYLRVLLCSLPITSAHHQLNFKFHHWHPTRSTAYPEALLRR